MAKVAEVAPWPTVTLAGTETAELALESAICAPPAGGGGGQRDRAGGRGPAHDRGGADGDGAQGGGGGAGFPAELDVRRWHTADRRPDASSISARRKPTDLRWGLITDRPPRSTYAGSSRRRGGEEREEDLLLA